MKILIVNGFAKTPKGKDEFNRYLAIIQEIFRTQTDFVDTNFEFMIRGRDDLDEFIYELDSTHLKKNAAKAFDYIDMVFIDGEPNLLPWSPKISKILILLRMCMKTKKILFASSFAMQALVFLSATNVERNVRVINGRGKGGKVADIMNISQSFESLKHEDLYLDNVTGDLYGYNHETSEWVPKMNAGIHFIQAAQGHDSLGKYVMNTPSYKAKVFEDRGGSAFLSQQDEDFCYTKKLYLQHWAIADLPSEFVIPAKNSWNIHKFNFTNQRKQFSVVAESKKTPQIIIFEPYCVATLFSISKRYALTASILKNFILSKLKEVKGMKKENNIGIEKASEAFRSGPSDFFNFSSEAQNIPAAGRKLGGPKQNSHSKTLNSLDQASLDGGSSSNRPVTTKLVHSGYALSHGGGGNLIVENNTVQADRTIRVTSSDKFLNTRHIGSQPVSAHGSRKITMSNFDTYFDGIRTISPKSTRFIVPTSPSHNNEVLSLHNYFQKLRDKKPESRSSGIVRFHQQDSLKDYGYDSNTHFQTNSDMEQLLSNKNRAEVARMLYPQLPRDAVKEEELWIPGQLSKSRPQTATAAKSIVKIASGTNFGSRFYTSFSKFKGSDPDSGRDKPSIRTSGAYMTDDEKKRFEEKENSKKNLGPAYMTAGTKVRPKMIKNYVTLTYSEPTANHKFREVSRDKWLNGNMKLC